MFRRSSAVEFRPVPYQRARRSPRVPRWAMILCAGVAIGAGGLWYLQENHLPPRLGAGESRRVLGELSDATRERDRLRAELAGSQSQLRSAQADATQARQALGNARDAFEALRRDVDRFVRILPADPRGGAIAIRAGSFGVTDGALAYHVVLTRGDGAREPFRGAVQLAVLGQRATGREDTVLLEPAPAAVGAYEHLEGSRPLPAGFSPRQVTVRVLDRPGGGMVSMRIFHVR